MTTERRRAPRIDLSGLEWKLAIVAALAGSYVALWFGLRAPNEPPQPVSVTPPAGWMVATGDARATPAPARITRPRRIKTRSS